MYELNIYIKFIIFLGVVSHTAVVELKARNDAASRFVFSCYKYFCVYFYLKSRTELI
jgi:hypothetical protein